jgi:hypothetical protein
MPNKKFVIQMEKSSFCKKISHNAEINLPLSRSPYEHNDNLWIVKLLKDNVVQYTIEIYRSPVHESPFVWRAVIKEKETDKIIALDTASTDFLNDAIEYFHDRIEDGLVERNHINPRFNTDKDFVYDWHLCDFIHPEKTRVHVKIGHLIFRGELAKSVKYDCVTFDVNLFKADSTTVLRSITVNKQDVNFGWL